MTIELVSYADLKALLGLESATIAGYPSLSVIQLSVLAAIEEHLGRELEQIERTATVHIGDWPSKMVVLKGLPIISVDSVAITLEDGDTVVDADYYTTGYGLKLHSAVRNAAITVTYTGGITTVPPAIVRGALLQTSYEFQTKDHIGAESVSTDGGMVSSPPLGLLSEVKRMLTSQMHPLKWC